MLGKHADFLCKNYVLNALDNSLYNIHCEATYAKELWESLDKKYKIEGVGVKTFMVGCFMNFTMVDPKTPGSQVQELQLILGEIKVEGM
jgi:hypothetical protein